MSPPGVKRALWSLPLILSGILLVAVVLISQTSGGVVPPQRQTTGDWEKTPSASCVLVWRLACCACGYEGMTQKGNQRRETCDPNVTIVGPWGRLLPSQDIFQMVHFSATNMDKGGAHAKAS